MSNLSYLGETASGMVQRDIEAETSMAIDRVLADAIKADMVERFTDRYDLGDLPGYVTRKLEASPRLSWRSALSGKIGRQGAELSDEIEAAVREYLPTEDNE